MNNYITKPRKIEAIQFTGKNIKEIEEFLKDTIYKDRIRKHGDSFFCIFNASKNFSDIDFSEGDYIAKIPHYWNYTFIEVKSDAEFEFTYKKDE